MLYLVPLGCLGLGLFGTMRGHLARDTLGGRYCILELPTSAAAAPLPQFLIPLLRSDTSSRLSDIWHSPRRSGQYLHDLANPEPHLPGKDGEAATDRDHTMNYEVNAGSSHEEPQGMYQCGVCKRSYKRLDHLSRHARTRECQPCRTTV